MDGTMHGLTVESQFCVLERLHSHPQPPAEHWLEDEPDTFPQQRFVDLAGDDGGLTLLNEGLPEYAITAQGEITVTLLRAVGRLGGKSSAIRYASGPELPTPGAQCPGWSSARYALYPHGGDWRTGGVLREVEEFQLPCRTIIGTGHSGTLPPDYGFIAIDTDDLAWSALKQTEEGGAANYA